MTTDAKPPAALLICSSGELAGSRFELGPETTIGLDARNHLGVASGAGSFATRLLRIVVRQGSYHLDVLDARVDVRLDGTVAAGTVSLDRRHVIALRDHAEFVYSRMASAARDTPSREAPAVPQPVVGGERQRTDVGQDGVAELPELRKSGPTKAAEPPRPENGTMVDEGAFDALPALSKGTPPAGRNLDEVTLMIPPSADTSPFELAIDLPGLGPATFRLKYGDNVIGRGQDADIKIPDPRKWLSRKHVIVRVSADGVGLIDLAGTNGTFVKGERITTAVLTPGSSFDLGPSLAFTLRKQ